MYIYIYLYIETREGNIPYWKSIAVREGPGGSSHRSFTALNITLYPYIFFYGQKNQLLSGIILQKRRMECKIVRIYEI